MLLITLGKAVDADLRGHDEVRRLKVQPQTIMV